MTSRSERRLRGAGLAALALFAASPLLAQQTPAPADPARVHVVRPGDTLWDLARQYLSDPFLWPDIFRLNTGVVEDPARIYPAERLRIPGGVEVVAVEVQEDLAFQRPDAVRDAAGPTVRPAGTADVPIVTPGDFYGAGFIAPEGEVAPVGVLAERLSVGAVPVGGPTLITLYDKVYVTLADPAAVQVRDRLHFFRPGRSVKPFGQLYHSTGIGTVEAVDGAVATVVVTDVYDPLATGNVALPAERFPVVAGVSPDPGSGVQGRVVAFETPHILQSTQNVAYLDVGRGSGVSEGDEFEVYLPSERQRWGVRPEVSVARLRVVRITERTAAARVTELEHPALRTGLPVRLVAKMP